MIQYKGDRSFFNDSLHYGLKGICSLIQMKINIDSSQIILFYMSESL